MFVFCHHLINLIILSPFSLLIKHARVQTYTYIMYKMAAIKHSHLVYFFLNFHIFCLYNLQVLTGNGHLSAVKQ